MGSITPDSYRVTPGPNAAPAIRERGGRMVLDHRGQRLDEDRWAIISGASIYCRTDGWQNDPLPWGHERGRWTLAEAFAVLDVVAPVAPRPGIRAASYRYTHDGSTIRVVIAGDVIALPDEGWSCGGFGSHISEEWLLTQPRPKIPGREAWRRVLVTCVRAAMEEHHEKAGASGGETR